MFNISLLNTETGFNISLFYVSLLQPFTVNGTGAVGRIRGVGEVAVIGG